MLCKIFVLQVIPHWLKAQFRVEANRIVSGKGLNLKWGCFPNELKQFFDKQLTDRFLSIVLSNSQVTNFDFLFRKPVSYQRPYCSIAINGDKFDFRTVQPERLADIAWKVKWFP